MNHKVGMVGAAALTLTLVATACGSSKSSTSAPKALGAGEKALSIIAWAGYAENGSTDPAQNWVKPFEDQTGCKTTEDRRRPRPEHTGGPAEVLRCPIGK